MKYRKRMKSRKQTIRQVSVRWPEAFWEKASIQATKRRTSLQAIITEAVANHLGIAPPTELQTEPNAQ